MFELGTQLPNDRRNFVHKRILGAATSFITSGFNPVAAATTFFKGPPRTQPTKRRAAIGPVGQVFQTRSVAPVPISSNAGCPSGTWKDSQGRCRSDRGTGPIRIVNVPGVIGAIQRIIPGGATGLQTAPAPAALVAQSGMANDVVMGRYGAAYVPGSMIVDRAVCLPGDVVGDDGLCYPKKSLKNDERAWPRGRRPLLTGGEMRAISIASRAAGRLTRTAVRLQDMGLIKKPVAKRPRKKS